MVLDAERKVFLCRAHIHNELVLCTGLFETVQYYSKKLHRRIYRNRKDDDIALIDTFLKTYHTVHKTYLFRRRSIHRVIVHSQHLRGKTFSLKIYRH